MPLPDSAAAVVALAVTRWACRSSAARVPVCPTSPGRGARAATAHERLRASDYASRTPGS